METETPRAARIWASTWRYGLAILMMVFLWVGTSAEWPGLDTPGGDPRAIWFVTADPLIGLICLALMRWRHRHPTALTAITTICSMISASAAPSASWMLGSLTSHARWKLLPFAVGGSVIAVFSMQHLYPATGSLPWWANLLVAAAGNAVVIAIGLAMLFRRQRFEALVERAETAESEQAARVDQARTAERSRIAREMHDVLAHRISLIAMHASALNFRTDLSEAERHAAAKTLEDNAHQALRDLRDVLGVLRDPNRPGDAPPEPPQPGAHDLVRLVDENRGSGMRITYTDATEGEIPDVVARTAYRVVQEGLTNVRKHAPGVNASVALTGNQGDGLSVTIRNAKPVAPAPIPTSLPRSGLGMVGLEERVHLAGGRIRYGRVDGGGFAVEVWLPWTVRELPAAGASA